MSWRVSTTAACRSGSSSGSSGARTGRGRSAARSIPEHRPTDEPKADDVIFAGYELEDALDHANEALEDEVRVLEEEGLDVKVAPFTRQEILPKLEHRFLHEM